PLGKAQGDLQEQCRLGSLLGSGGFSSVCSGTRLLDGAPVKSWHGLSPPDGIMLPPQPDITQGPLEIMLLDKVSPGCAGVIQLLEWVELPSTFFLVLVKG
ncbi:PIM1 kinase, partial [Certhia familiaris]|nr:PIM1 kinase [Certhia familiaris]